MILTLLIALSICSLGILPAAQAEPSYSAADSITNADLSNQVVHARALFVSQKTKEALADYNRIIPLLPTNPKQREKYALAFLGRADALEALGQYEKAAADAKTYFAFEPSSRWSSDRVCRMEAEGGYYKEGAANLKNYLFSTANHSAPYALLCVCSAFENDRTTSVDCLMQAINYKFGKFERKIENGPFCSEQTFVVLRNYCQTNLHSKPKDAGKHFALGMIDALLANNKPAIEQFTDSLKLNPALWQSMTARANCYLSIGNLDEALKDINQALESHPKEQINYSTLERYYNLKGSFDAFIADLNRRIAKDPKNAQLWLAKAGAFEKLTDTAKAIDAYTHAITVDPKCSEAFLKRGRLREELLKYDDAIADFTSAIRLSPADPYAYRDRASCYLALGKTNETIADTSRVIELTNDPSAYQARAECYARTGKKDLAAHDRHFAAQNRGHFLGG